MIPKQLWSVLSKDPGVVHGAICFAKMRVPIQTLIDYQEEGLSLDNYLADYPSVPRESAEKLLRYLADRSRELFELERESVS